MTVNEKEYNVRQASVNWSLLTTRLIFDDSHRSDRKIQNGYSSSRRNSETISIIIIKSHIKMNATLRKSLPKGETKSSKNYTQNPKTFGKTYSDPSLFLLRFVVRLTYLNALPSAFLLFITAGEQDYRWEERVSPEKKLQKTERERENLE